MGDRAINISWLSWSLSGYLAEREYRVVHEGDSTFYRRIKENKIANTWILDKKPPTAPEYKKNHVIYVRIHIFDLLFHDFLLFFPVYAKILFSLLNVFTYFPFFFLNITCWPTGKVIWPWRYIVYCINKSSGLTNFSHRGFKKVRELKQNISFPQ